MEKRSTVSHNPFAGSIDHLQVDQVRLGYHKLYICVYIGVNVCIYVCIAVYADRIVCMYSCGGIIIR